MKVLFLATEQEDYLSDSLLVGLRKLFGEHCIDVPMARRLYKDYDEDSELYGNGFTLYRVLEPMQIDRNNVEARLRAGDFDLVVFGSIWEQYDYFVEVQHLLNPDQTLIFDGADSERVVPYAGRWFYSPGFSSLPKPQFRFKYFKREWTTKSRFSVFAAALPDWATRLFPPHGNLNKTAFSIPANKIVTKRPVKTKDFPSHIVDGELAALLGGQDTGYKFTREEDYYNDLRTSKFGITTKRSGWDCLRHYEIAANCAVPCFRDLDLKPATCAPHGLNAMNSISYRNASDLLTRIDSLSENEYIELQSGAMAWVVEHSCEARARQLISSVGKVS